MWIPCLRIFNVRICPEIGTIEYSLASGYTMIIKPSVNFSTIERLKIVVIVSTLFFALLQSIHKTECWQVADLFTTTSYHSTLRDFLLAPLSACTLNYSSISLQMLFDFLILNAFVTPLVSFVFSFLGKKNFFLYTAGCTLISSLALHSIAFLCDKTFVPTTLFSHVALGMITFWALVHTKHTPTMFLFLPMNPSTILAISCIIAGYTAITTSDWVYVTSLFISMLYAYFVSVFFVRLKSGNSHVERFEEWLIDSSLWCERMWWRMRSVFKR